MGVKKKRSSLTSLIYNKQMKIAPISRNEHKWINRKCLFPFSLALLLVWSISTLARPPSPGAVRGNLPRSGGLTLPQDITMEELVPPGEEESTDAETKKSDDSAQAPSKDDTVSDQAPALSPVEE